MVEKSIEPGQRELAERIRGHLGQDGKAEVRPGLFFYRLTTTDELLHGVSEPSLCVIAQGSKEVFLNDRSFRYDPAHYLISSMELPVSGRIVAASKAKPYLSLRLRLDPSIATSILSEIGYTPGSGESSSAGIDVSPLGEPLFDAVLRLVRLLDDPLEYQVLGKQTIREITFRLATGEQVQRLRHIAQLGGQSHRMVRAIRTIRERFDQPLSIETLATELSMSASSFHSHFKAATAMSPLQFQKQLRLQEARRLLLDENKDAAEAGFSVGYEDAAQFSREYKRQFGLPPKRDADRLRNNMSPTS